MIENKPIPRPDLAVKDTKDQKAPASQDAGLKAQIDEAKEQGAGKTSVPLGETNTANDSGASSV